MNFAMDQDRFAAHEARMDSLGAELDRDEPYEGDESLPRPARLERFYDEATGAWWTRLARESEAEARADARERSGSWTYIGDVA